mmetsp:Transcript_105544/g.305286  ORF Transcript_105544/g.305286 Transcript_105544/m.305286 type:complete len:213 (-) Transcript_105544:657-1295(-)
MFFENNVLFLKRFRIRRAVSFFAAPNTLSTYIATITLNKPSDMNTEAAQKRIPKPQPCVSVMSTMSGRPSLSAHSPTTMHRKTEKKEVGTDAKYSEPPPSVIDDPKASRSTKVMAYTGMKINNIDQRSVRIPPTAPRTMTVNSANASSRMTRTMRMMRTIRKIRNMEGRPTTAPTQYRLRDASASSRMPKATKVASRRLFQQSLPTKYCGTP